MDNNQQVALPIDADLMTQDTSFPVLKGEQTLDFKIEKAEVKMTAKNAKMLSIEASTINAAQGNDGGTINAGCRVFGNCMLEASGKMTAAQVVRGPTSIAAFVQAVGIPMTLRDLPNRVKEFEGRIFRAKVAYVPQRMDPATGKTYGERNEFASFVKQGQ